MCVVSIVLKYWNRPNICIYKHHHQLSGGFPGDPLLLFQCVIQMQWSLQIFLDQASDLILSHFQEEDHPFIRKALGDENIHLLLYCGLTYRIGKLKTKTNLNNN